MFDPERVERVVANAKFTDDDGQRRCWDYDVVRAEDYDQLLKLYREADVNAITLAESIKKLLDEPTKGQYSPMIGRQ